MAMRNYMQGLILAHTSGYDHHEENGMLNITIVDDNSFSALPDDHRDEDSEHESTSTASTTGAEARSHGGGSCHDTSAGERDHDIDHDDSCSDNRIMLDGFRRRQRFLRETLSPRKQQPQHHPQHQRDDNSSSSPLPFAPSPMVLTQWTPSKGGDDGYDDDFAEDHYGSGLPRDSQRGRMRRLKSSLRIQGNSVTPFV